VNPMTGEILGPDDMTEKQRDQVEKMAALSHELKFGKRALVPIPDNALSKVQQMNLKERRKWAIKKKKAERQARRQARRHRR